MKHQKYNLIKLFFVIVIFISSCSKKEEIKTPAALLNKAFECASIGEVEKLTNYQWNLHLANDNNNPNLPDSWRNWWYVKLENLPTNIPCEIKIKNRGWPFYYLPVYSYNQTDWFRFTEDEVSENADYELTMTKQFENADVFVARFYPYTFSDLETYLNTLSGNPFVDIQTPGFSQNGKAIYCLKITDTNIPNTDKKRVFMHARTHPGETPPSFLIEGIVDFLLANSADAQEILQQFEFYIFPMQNTDGVIAGNYRSTPNSENLEVKWYYDTENPLFLTPDAPSEVNIIHNYAMDLMNDGGPAISMALNLHASNGEPDLRTFFYPHFGSEALGYETAEASLWEKQLSFINSFATNFGIDMIEPTTSEGGSSFASKTYPESWWWVNFQDQVMAMTMEMTYGRSGFSPRWIEPNYLRDMGKSLTLGIRDYYNHIDNPLQILTQKSSDITNLKFPQLYAPNDVDEGKE